MNIKDQTSVLLMARSGSTRLINKNLAPFGPKDNKETLLEWKIKQLLEVFPPKSIILSSDSDAYLDIGSTYNLTLHKRNSDLTDFGSFAENLRVVASQSKAAYIMYANGPCNPLIGPRRMRDFITHVEGKDLDKGFCAVEELKGYFGFHGNWLNFEPGENHIGSEFLENPFRVVWGLSIRTRANVISDGAMISQFDSSYVVPSWSSVDIDYPEDLVIAQSFLDKYTNYEQTGIE